ncbi:methyltransferase domain-containing protein [Candidatus Poribacteria bacterium]|nr:methyltransferase domain-containing protein [Candidatus Poribacteria bacterium]
MRKDSWRYRFEKRLYQRQCACLAPRIEALYAQVLDSLDREAFRARFRDYWRPCPGAESPKFLDLDLWLREAVTRYVWGMADTLPKESRILDLGCGTGYFMAVCRLEGHDVLGLDLDTDPLYNEMMAFFGLERAVHRIEPMRPLPELGSRFDVITAHMTCFNWHEDVTPWNEREWAFLLEDLRGRLRPGGWIQMRLNLNPKTNEFYSPQLKRAFVRMPGFRCEPFLDYVTWRTA